MCQGNGCRKTNTLLRPAGTSPNLGEEWLPRDVGSDRCIFGCSPKLGELSAWLTEECVKAMAAACLDTLLRPAGTSPNLGEEWLPRDVAR